MSARYPFASLRVGEHFCPAGIESGHRRAAIRVTWAWIGWRARTGSAARFAGRRDVPGWEGLLRVVRVR